jgi:anaerobic magnesium-protoporphyrin IX monomethyl ester cyclase
VDYGILGEGDITIVDLLEAIESGRDLSAVEGIIFNSQGTPLVTTARKVWPDLDTLPMPDYEGFELRKYLDLQKCLDFWFLTEDNPRALPLVASRSCPYNCSFCYHVVSHYRQVSLSRLFADIDYLVPKYDINFIFVYDDLFASRHNNDRLREFCERIKDYDIQWYCQLRVDSKLNESLLRDMHGSGCVAIGLGIEHIDQNVLRSMNKNITRKQIDTTLPMVYQSGVGIAPNILLGDIAETKKTIQACDQWFSENQQYQLSVVEVIPYPGTQLYKTGVDNGFIPDRLEYIKAGCPGVNFTALNNQEYSSLIRKFREKYYLPSENVSMKTDYDDQRGDLYTIVSRCTHCGEMNVHTRVSKILVNEIGCKKCRHRYYRFRNEDYYFYIDLPKLQSLIKTKPDIRIAICGPTKIIAALVNSLDFSYHDNIVKVFDTNPQKEGVEIGNYVTEKWPDNWNCLKEQIDVVFIAAQFSYTEIYNAISEVLKYGIKIV